jgi:GT2 family glycosyltransferase
VEHQTFRNFEVIIVDKEWDLVKCRDYGWRQAKGEIVVFIDDDMVMKDTWLENIINLFKDEDVVGVTGPTIVPISYLYKRDVLKYIGLYKFFNKSERPGYFSKWGAPSMFSNFNKDYFGEVDYLECCNMALKKDVIEKVGGFDLSYEKTSEWSEVDLSMRCKEYGRLIFSPECSVIHMPTQAGVYKNRFDSAHRYRNYLRFSNKWLKPCWQLSVYKKLYYLYLKQKEKWQH